MLSEREEAIICPKCESITQSGKQKPKCYVNREKGVYYCYHCKATGRIENLGREEGEQVEARSASTTFFPDTSRYRKTEHQVSEFQRNLLHANEAKQYLASRLKTHPAELSDKYRLGCTDDGQFVTIPHYNIKGKLVGIKLRNIDRDSEMRYLSLKGSDTKAYYLPAASDSSNSPLIVCEGELDAIAIKTAGFEGAVLALSKDKPSRPALKILNKHRNNLYLLLDNDDVGEEASERLLQTYPDARVLELDDEFKDFGELLEARGLEAARSALTEMLQKSSSMIEEITFRLTGKMDEAIEFLKDPNRVKGDSSGIPALDQILGGGFRPGEMTVYHGEAKTGKSTVLTQLSLNLAKAGHPVGWIQLEMSPSTEMLPNMINQLFGINSRKFDDEQLENLLKDRKNQLQVLNNVLCLDGYGQTDVEILTSWIRYNHRQFGIRHFFFDHVGYSMKDPASVSEASLLARAMKALTREMPIHLHLIVQPRKVGFGEELGQNTLFGSIAWAQALDNLITLTRTPNATHMLTLKLALSRYPMAIPDGINGIQLSHCPVSGRIS